MVFFYVLVRNTFCQEAKVSALAWLSSRVTILHLLKTPETSTIYFSENFFITFLRAKLLNLIDKWRIVMLELRIGYRKISASTGDTDKFPERKLNTRLAKLGLILLIKDWQWLSFSILWYIILWLKLPKCSVYIFYLSTNTLYIFFSSIHLKQLL